MRFMEKRCSQQVGGMVEEERSRNKARLSAEKKQLSALGAESALLCISRMVSTTDAPANNTYVVCSSIIGAYYED